MKKLIFLLITSSMLIIFAACGNENEPQAPPELTTTTKEQIDSPPDEADEIDETGETDVGDAVPGVPQEDAEPEDLFALWDFSALELVGYYFDEDNRLFIDTEGWVEIDDPNVVKEFFYGTWERSNGMFLTVNDMSENNYFWWMCDGFYKAGDNVIVSAHWDMAGPNYYYWIDMNEPDIMFFLENWMVTPQNTVNYETTYWTKTDAPLNYPEDGFLTWFREWEITLTYDINPEMLTSIEFQHEKSGRVLNREARWRYFEMYLILETPEKLVFNVPLDSCVGMSPSHWADAIVTLEKINGEWVRTIEVSEVTHIQFTDGEWVYTVETV